MKTKKYTIEELQKMLNDFHDSHPDTHEDECYAPINLMEADGAASFLNWIKTGKYGDIDFEGRGF